MVFRRALSTGVIAIAVVLSAAQTARASAVVLGAYNSSSLAANDDGSTGFVSFGFSDPLNFFGVSETGAYLNNNGNITFDHADGTYTPSALTTSGNLARLAPFFADVDTRGTSSLMTYGTGTFDGHQAFGVNWGPSVGYFSQSPGPNRNSFQLIVVDRPDTGVGNFDFIFNYDAIQWEAGTASSSDSQGCGGTSAYAGWTNGVGTFFQFPGSGVHGAFLDSGNCVDGSPYAGAGANDLVTNSINSNVAGRDVFNVRAGVVTDVTQPPAVPEPASLVLLGTGLVALARRRLRARQA